MLPTYSIELVNEVKILTVIEKCTHTTIRAVFFDIIYAQLLNKLHFGKINVTIDFFLLHHFGMQALKVSNFLQPIQLITTVYFPIYICGTQIPYCKNAKYLHREKKIVKSIENDIESIKFVVDFALMSELIELIANVIESISENIFDSITFRNCHDLVFN